MLSALTHFSIRSPVMPTLNLADQLLGDPDRLKTLLSALATGADLAIAAGLVMIRKRDLERALTENEDLALRVEQAVCQFQHSQLQRVYVAARNERNWKCAIWLLERRFPRKFGRPQAKATSRERHRQDLKGLANWLLAQVEDPENRRKMRAAWEKSRADRWSAAPIANPRPTEARREASENATADHREPSQAGMPETPEFAPGHPNESSDAGFPLGQSFAAILAAAGLSSLAAGASESLEEHASSPGNEPVQASESPNAASDHASQPVRVFPPNRKSFRSSARRRHRRR